MHRTVRRVPNQQLLLSALGVSEAARALRARAASLILRRSRIVPVMRTHNAVDTRHVTRYIVP